MITGKKVIIVDDEIDFRNELSSFLASLGAFVFPCSNVSEFLEKLDRERPDLALVDKEIGYENGFDIIHSVRKNQSCSNIPIIVITGLATEENKNEAIHLGADDVLSKPLSARELERRLIANLRRSNSYAENEKVISVDDIKVNLTKHSLTMAEEVIDLTKTEYKIIRELILKQGQIVNREHIAQRFLSINNSSVRTIDVHVNSLRKKLGHYGARIKTIRGRGYMFHSDAS